MSDQGACARCADFGAVEPVFVLDSLISTELGWCGCGQPEQVDRMMLAYLSSRDHDASPSLTQMGSPPTRRFCWPTSQTA